MNAIQPKLPETPVRRRGFFGLAVTSLLFALAFLPAPLVVLYQLNDECLRDTSWGMRLATWDTLFRVPPSPVARHLDLMVRAAVVGSILGGLFLLGTAIATFRSRPATAVRLHAIYAAYQLVVMTALAVSAHQFSTAIDASSPQRDWAMRLSAGSAVRNLAVGVAFLGLLYPLVLSLLYWRYPGEKRNDDGR